jgi:penicillin V acylase-like amidase (Ntn superfamily)
MKKLAAIVLTIFLISLLTSSVGACTTFCLKNKGEVLFGKNYDWDIGHGLVFVNRRGVSKMSAEETNPAKWVSKYGSVTFNQYGWESPSGGMNEAGLVIELMWLDDTQYPPADERPAIDVLEWIQFQLDTSATTGEVIRNSESVRVVSKVPLHYLVNDNNGNSATIEFLNGKLVPHTGDKLPVATLTNDTYARSIDFASKKDAGATRSMSSLDRFARASAKTKEFAEKPLGEKEAVDYAFGILTNAAQGKYTQWSIVYDQKRAKVYFRTQKHQQIRSFNARSFDYGCTSPVLTFDMNTSDAGDVTHLFTRYARSTNRGLIEMAFNGTDFLKSVPADVRDSYADFPDRFTCNGVAPEKVPALKARTSAAVSYLEIVFPAYYIYKRFIA